MEDSTELRLLRLERQLKLAWTLAVLSSGISVLMLLTSAEPTTQHLTLRSLTVVDGAGVPRVLIGAPLPGPDGQQRQQESTGIVINDADGAERFGVGVMPDGSIGMGFDAPPGVGDQRNRERLYLGVTPAGNGYWHLLDNATRIRAQMVCNGDTGEADLYFLDWTKDGVDYLPIGLEQARRLQH
jgi:hypothetical protein